MPKRVIDFDAMWGSDKLAACASWAQAEYAWLYGLADASGCFELTNLRVIWGRVAAIRANLSIERLEQVFAEFQEKGLLFVWEHEGKRYAHWTGSDVPGRLPPPSWRMRLEKFAPPVPKQRLSEYMSKFARGRAALAGAGFGAREAREDADRGRDCRFEASNLKGVREEGGRGMARQDCGGAGAGAGGIKAGVEGTPAQDLDWDRNLEGERDGRRGGTGGGRVGYESVCRKEGVGGSDSCSSNANLNSNLKENSGPKAIANSNSNLNSNSKQDFLLGSNSNSAAQESRPTFSKEGFYSEANVQGMSAKELAVLRELRVGQGPVCGPRGVKPEVIERDRRRQAARGV